MKEGLKFLLIIIISICMVIFALYINSLAQQKLKVLEFDSFDILVEGRENILNPSILYPGQRGYIVVNNLRGYGRNEDGKLNLVAIVQLYNQEGTLVVSQTKILHQYSSVKDDSINKLRISFELNSRLMPGVYKLRVTIVDSNLQQSVFHERTLLVEGKLQ